VPLAGHGRRPLPLRRRAGRPQLKRDPLGLTRDLASRPLPPHLESMTPKALLDQVLKLPPAERLQLIEDVWDSLAATPDSVPVPEWHKAELDRLLDHPSPEPSVTWEEVQAKLRDLK